MDMVDLSKKRKLQAEQFDLPIPKHKCCNRSLTSNPFPLLRGNQAVDDFCIHVTKGKTLGGATYDVSVTESGKDSNSFAEDSYYSVSQRDEYSSYVAEDHKTETEIEKAKIWVYDGTPSSSSNWPFSSSKELCNSWDSPTMSKGVSGKDKSTSASSESCPCDDDKYQYAENRLMETESHVDYICSGYEIESIEEYKEIEEILYSNDTNPNVYVLSSGRWSVNKDAQQGSRKPTIDQEFEQYFSMLML